MVVKHTSDDINPLKIELSYVFRCCNKSWNMWRHSASWTVRSLSTVSGCLRNGLRRTSLYEPSRNVGSTGALPAVCIVSYCFLLGLSVNW